MTVARALLWPPLCAGAVLVATGALGNPPSVLHGRSCEGAACPLTQPTVAELDAIVADADRIVARYAGDPTPLGRQCHVLGATMHAHAADVRMLAYMWRVVDPDGYPAPVTGDAHRVEVVAGSREVRRELRLEVHIARGYDALNPDRGLPAIVQTARHEFAHLSGAPQNEGWRVDGAAALATACGPS